MRTNLPAVLLMIFAGCVAPQKERRIVHLVNALEDVYQWDPERGAYKTQEYGLLLQSGVDAVEDLAPAILDKRPTKIMDRYPDQVPLVGDVVFLILIEITGKRIEDFESAGVRYTGDRNPIFALEFGPGARARARDKFLEDE